MNINTGGGLIGLLILIGDIWAIINILQSNAGMGGQAVVDSAGGVAAAAGADYLVCRGPARREGMKKAPGA
jgi:hypothetical protein